MLHVRLAEERQTKHQRGREKGNRVVLLFFTFSLIFLFVCFKKRYCQHKVCHSLHIVGKEMSQGSARTALPFGFGVLIFFMDAEFYGNV